MLFFRILFSGSLLSAFSLHDLACFSDVHHTSMGSLPNGNLHPRLSPELQTQISSSLEDVSLWPPADSEGLGFPHWTFLLSGNLCFPCVFHFVASTPLPSQCSKLVICAVYHFSLTLGPPVTMPHSYCLSLMNVFLTSALQFIPTTATIVPAPRSCHQNCCSSCFLGPQPLTQSCPHCNQSDFENEHVLGPFPVWLHTPWWLSTDIQKTPQVHMWLHAPA